MAALAGAQPNILLIMADQHRYDCVGCNGNRLIRTPALDRLAAGGVGFSHAFTPSPVCVPARTSLLHGCWPGRHGCIVNEGLGVPHRDTRGLPSFSAQLKQAGYWLGHVGKWQLSAGTPPTEFGFDQSVSREGYSSWRAARGRPPIPHTNGWFGEVDPHITANESHLGWEADRVADMIGRRASHNQPFFIRWDCSEPHLPCIVPEPFASLYDPDDIPPWPSFDDPLRDKPYIQGQQQRTWRLQGKSWEEWARTVAIYMGEISLIDAQLGRVLNALMHSGVLEDTLVVYTSDHGDLCGGHGMIDKHYVMYDDVVRVPMIASWPGGIQAAGRGCADFVVNALDLATTFCELAGAPVPDTFQGTSLLPVLDGSGGTGRDDVCSVYHGNQFGLYTQRMLRTSRWKYVWNATAEDELYDVAEDPGELHNRACDAQCAETLRDLRHRLVAWMEESGDPQLNPWIRDQLLAGLKR